jgi:hypothetical protein
MSLILILEFSNSDENGAHESFTRLINLLIEFFSCSSHKLLGVKMSDSFSHVTDFMYNT